MDWPSIENKNYELNDMAQFAMICIMILRSLSGDYDSNRYRGMSNALERATAADLHSRYKTADDFYAAVSQYFDGVPFIVEG